MPEKPTWDEVDARWWNLLQRAWDEGYAAGAEDAEHGWRSHKNPYVGQTASN